MQKVVRSAQAALLARDDVEIHACSPPHGASLLRWRQTGLVRAAREAHAGVLHSWTSAFPLAAGIPVTQTVHEAPWRHGARENAGPRHRLWARLGRSRAALVVTPSTRVAEDLGGHAKLRVIPWGVDEAYASDSNPVADAALLRSLPEATKRVVASEPFVMVLGGTRPKKRLELVAAAASRTSSGPLPVIVTGPITAYAGSIAALHPHVHLAGIVDEPLIPALVRRAGVAAIFSRSEGFALPVLEAMAAGVPVVVAKATVQADTAGGFGLAVDPLDADEAAGALEAAQVDSAAHRDRLRAGEAYARSHTWARCTDGLVAAWRSLLEAR